MKSRSRKASLNIGVMAIYEVTAFICGLILPRLILSHFGSTYNGIINSATQFLSFVSILRLGIAGSTRVALYKTLADNDHQKISGIVNATENYMRKIGLVIIAYIVVLAIIYPYISDTGVDRFTTVMLIIIIGAGTFAQYFFGITYQTLLNADQSSYIYYLISIFQTIANTIIAAILIYLGANILIVRSGSAVVFVTTPIILGIVVRRRYHIDKKAPLDKSGLKGRWDVMGISIANIIHDNTDIVVLTIFADIKIVSVYTVYYLVINGLKKLMNVFTNGMEPAFGNMLALGEMDAANRNMDIFEFLMYAFVSVVFSCTLVLILPFVRLYTAGVNDVNYIVPTFAYLAVIAMAVQCIRQPYLTIVQAAGHYRQTRNGAFVEAGINIGLSLALTFRYGLVGVTIGTLAANTFRTIQYIFYLRNNILNRSLKKVIKSLIWMFVTLVIIVWICSILLQIYNIYTWVNWIVAGVFCLAIALGVTFVSALIFQRKKLILAKDVVKRMLPSKK